MTEYNIPQNNTYKGYTLVCEGDKWYARTADGTLRFGNRFKANVLNRIDKERGTK